MVAYKILLSAPVPIGPLVLGSLGIGIGPWRLGGLGLGLGLDNKTEVVVSS